MINKAWVLTVAILCVNVGCVESGPTDVEIKQAEAEQQHRLEKENQTKSAASTEVLAEQGDAEAQLKLANFYINGVGVSQNYETAVVFLTKSAIQGNADAQSQLGALYYNGEFVEQDLVKAYEWLVRAAHQGDANASHLMGIMYADGNGVDLDEDKAAIWFERACKNGYNDDCKPVVEEALDTEQTQADAQASLTTDN